LSEYRVELEVYNGPLDLLLFLIRREEVDIHDIPISRITEQYLAYVDLLRQLDPEAVSEFLVMAATLTEIKSRTLLPRPPVEEGEEEVVDPRLELVRQLLLYKAFKDAARSLEHAAGEQAMRHPRSPASPAGAAEEMELENLELWDLFDAFNRLLEQIGRGEPYHEVAVDDTPMALHAADIVDSIERGGGSQRFEEIFLGRTRGEMIGLFLALLELMRQRRVRASQDQPFGPILIYLLDATPLDEVEEASSGEAFAQAMDREALAGGVGTAHARETGASPEGSTSVEPSGEEESSERQFHVEESDHESQ
jgi:segregation and condensation protein A